MSCPRCGSHQVQVVSESETKGFGAGKGCLGYLIFGPIGFLCGLCGMGKSKSTVFRICASCGFRFK
ncbi:hypothetical protein ACFQZR_07090 [Paenibacillus sp. GCM10027629]|uniref:hypothetical protein n=1 Tax=Paenibacillus sp. GCM10027629 TaxID=3273414 RepID=UPI003636F214